MVATLHDGAHSTPTRAIFCAAWAVVIEAKTNSRTATTGDAKINRLI
jgi:hypothetical protein